MSGRRSLIAIVLLAAALHAAGIARSILPAQDGLKFIRVARSFQSRAWADVVRGTDQHPLYPALVAIVEPAVACVWRARARDLAGRRATGRGAGVSGPDLPAPRPDARPLRAPGRRPGGAGVRAAAAADGRRPRHPERQPGPFRVRAGPAVGAHGAGFGAVGGRRWVAGSWPESGISRGRKSWWRRWPCWRPGSSGRPGGAARPRAGGRAGPLDDWPSRSSRSSALTRWSRARSPRSSRCGGAASIGPSAAKGRKAGQWLPPGLDDPRWDFSPKEEAAGVPARGVVAVAEDIVSAMVGRALRRLRVPRRLGPGPRRTHPKVDRGRRRQGRPGKPGPVAGRGLPRVVRADPGPPRDADGIPVGPAHAGPGRSLAPLGGGGDVRRAPGGSRSRSAGRRGRRGRRAWPCSW